MVSCVVCASRLSVREEAANTLTHALAAVLALAGLVVLVVLASNGGGAARVVGCSIFGACATLLYVTSTAYHGLRAPRAKAILRLFDHSAIFLLIAGTYTPFTLVNLRGPWGWSLLGVTWGLAVLGIVLRVAFGQRLHVPRVVLYVAMGWCAVVAVKPLMAAVPPGGVLLLLVGGVLYTSGIVFYAWRSLPYHHAVWHLFVMGGTFSHFLAVLWYVIPLQQG